MANIASHIVMARLDRAIQLTKKIHFAARTRDGWMAASSAAMTQNGEVA